MKVIPRIADEKKRLPEEKALLDLWLAMDEIKAKVSYVQPEIPFNEGGQLNLFLIIIFDFNCSAGILPAFV
ncbi:MAG: hypothetical protein V7K27_23095 [Nostoc sp.]|uniref:hypothetical protein n=1 Tax=Nostoc sp. TaxID=1180 RepID=UPI002FF5BCE3